MSRLYSAGCDAQWARGGRWSTAGSVHLSIKMDFVDNYWFISKSQAQHIDGILWQVFGRALGRCGWMISGDGFEFETSDHDTMHRRGIEPRSLAHKTIALTTRPRRLDIMLAYMQLKAK